MKASLKLLTSITTSKGHPIIIYLSGGYKDKRIRIGHHSLKKDWNEKLSEPKRTHLDYYELYRTCQDIKVKISKINHSCNSIEGALAILDSKPKSNFFDTCSNGLYKLDTKYSALKSFDKFAPTVNHKEITLSLIHI